MSTPTEPPRRIRLVREPHKPAPLPIGDAQELPADVGMDLFERVQRGEKLGPEFAETAQADL